MLVHIFGAVSSPSVAGFDLRQVAIDKKANVDQSVLATIQRHFYVDDCLQSVDLPVNAIKLVAELRRDLIQGGFKLTKFFSNSVEVINSIPEKDRAPALLNLDLDNLPVEGTFAVFWNTSSDNFEFHVRLRPKPCRRRGILSTISQVFNSMGFVQPFVLAVKRMLQDLWSQNLLWDCPIPLKQQEMWWKCLQCLPVLETVVVPQCLKSRPDFDCAELHCFSDASSVGYGACAYLEIYSCWWVYSLCLRFWQI